MRIRLSQRAQRWQPCRTAERPKQKNIGQIRFTKLNLIFESYLSKVLFPKSKLHPVDVWILIGLRLPVDKHFNNQDWIVEGQILKEKKFC